MLRLASTDGVQSLGRRDGYIVTTIPFAGGASRYGGFPFARRALIGSDSLLRRMRRKGCCIAQHGAHALAVGAPPVV